MITPEQIVLVRDSWKKVEPIADVAAKLFYNRLFEIDPALESLFKTDTKEQGAKLMKMIAMAVNALDEFETAMPMIQSSGRRHVGYDVKEEDYETVGAALLWTLDKGLGDAFTPEVKDAWTAVYGEIASIMKQAAREISG
uniref:Hemoglobin-like flavoprotein n=1 Tax=Candidatus Kentrum sp. SD TaxID=2126332 RepID=A0A450YEK8_9GAMM|nr:MAG: Hemoglobin-like flavoprotein [Candidatus Kentron sp. SD]VFK45389.1 MAG: Hemoglobin-like flavoprotein [Candidatus Kentron sp. SD]VFK79542.1 MAG: Hemoglobin-like flavoprotein [Candidatus Kentron sp. SD]